MTESLRYLDQFGKTKVARMCLREVKESQAKDRVEQHLDDTNTASGFKIPTKNLMKGVIVEDVEAAVGTRSEATKVLIEGKVKEVW
ncbi:hypothetical protein L1887_37850 [Cichorium endivia]|nr:hypothetical protein L1887_37850 [Cichorium endivia]